MTARGNFKRRVRARAAKTGESYTTALRHFRRTSGDEMPKTKTLRLAVARTTLRQDPRDAGLLRESGREVRRLMRDAYAAGARLVLFPEGATAAPAEVFATEAQAHAATNSYWVGYASDTGSGVVSPAGDWVARTGDEPIAVADLDGDVENLARPWRRTARNGVYEPHVVRDDPRSEDRAGF